MTKCWKQLDYIGNVFKNNNFNDHDDKRIYNALHKTATKRLFQTSLNKIIWSKLFLNKEYLLSNINCINYSNRIKINNGIDNKRSFEEIGAVLRQFDIKFNEITNDKRN